MFAVSLVAAMLAFPHAAVAGGPWQATIRAAARPTVTAVGPATTLRTAGVRAGGAWRVSFRFPAAGTWRLTARVGGRMLTLGVVSVDVARDPLLRDPIAVAVAADGALVVAQRDGPLLRLSGGRAAVLTSGVGAFHVARAGAALYVAAADGAAYRIDGGTATRVTPALDADAVAVDGAGNVYVAVYAGLVKKVTPDGAVTTLASGLAHPHSLALGSGGALYVADTEARRIRRIDLASGRTTTVGGDVGLTVSVAVAPDGTVWSADVPRDGAGGGIVRIAPDGTTSRVLSHPRVNGVAVAPDGTVYVDRWEDRRIDRLVGGRLEPVARG